MESANTRYDSLGTDRKEELAATRMFLKGARDWRRVAAQRRGMGLPMDTFSLDPDTAESKALHDFRSAGGPLESNQSDPPRHMLREVLDQLHAEMFLFQNHLDVRGKVDLTVDLGDGAADSDQRQVTQPSRGLGRGSFRLSVIPNSIRNLLETGFREMLNQVQHDKRTTQPLTPSQTGCATTVPRPDRRN